LITRGRKVRKDKGGRAHSKFSAKNAWSPYLGETTTILTIVAGLQRFATRIKPNLADELRAVRAVIDAVLISPAYAMVE
jgi:hypothetical protein